MKKISFLYILLTIFFIILWFYFVDFSKVAQAMKNVRWDFVLLAVLLGIINSFIAAFRLRILLRILRSVSLFYVWGIGNIASMISLISSISIGGAVVPYFLAKKISSSYTKTLAIFFMDFAINTSITFLVASIGIIYFFMHKSISIRFEKNEVTIFVLLLVLVIAFVLVTLFVTQRARIRSLLESIRRVWFLFSHARFIVGQAVVLALLMVIVSMLQFYLYFLAFGLHPYFLPFVFAVNIFALLGLIPGLPVKLGQYEAFGVLTLPYLLQIDKNIVFAALLVQHALSIAILLLSGIASLCILRLDITGGFLTQILKKLEGLKKKRI